MKPRDQHIERIEHQGPPDDPPARRARRHLHHADHPGHAGAAGRVGGVRRHPVVIAVAALALLVGPLAGIASAAPSSTVLYAYPGGTAATPATTCAQVTSTSSECSLADAITLAESTSGSVTIELAAGTYAITSEITIDDAETGPLTLAGPSGTTPTAVLSGAGLSVTGTTPVVLQDLEVTGGGAGGVSTASASTVTITGSTITGNTSTAHGGGIANGGAMTISGSIVSNNKSEITDTPAGGGIFNSGTLAMTGTVVSDNTAPKGLGGGISNFNGGTMTITGSTVAGNTSGNDAATFSFNGIGGGIYNGGTMTITGSTVSGNSALSALGHGHTPALGGGIASYRRLSITGSTVSHNTVQGEGGGVYIATYGCAFDGFTMAGSTVSANLAEVQGAGGGIYVSESRVATTSGCSGLSSTTDLAPMFVVDSTIAGNTVQDTIVSGTGYGVHASGGGIAMSSYGVAVDLVDSTVLGNAVTGVGNVDYVGGGGLADANNASRLSAADLWASGSVVADNTSDGTGTGNECSTEYTTTSATGYYLPVDAGYNFSTGGSCGFGTKESSSRDRAAISLGTLAANGGPLDGAAGETGALQTAALEGSLATNEAVGVIPADATATLPASYSSGSVADQSVSLCGTSSIATSDHLAGVSLDADERGVTRAGLSCDAGAYEQAPTSVAVTSIDPATPVVGTEAVVVAVTPSAPAAPPTGTVTVTASGPGSGSCTVTLTTASDGAGSCPVTLASAGNVTLALTYIGNEATSSGTDHLEVASSAPTLTGLSPTAGPIAGGTTVAVDGANLGGATAVDFASTASTSFACSASECLVVTPPSSVSGTVPVTVTGPGGTSNAESFDYTSSSSSSSPPGQSTPPPSTSPPACATGETACQSATSTTPAGSATAAVGGTIATAVDGEGTLTVAQYSADPVSSPAFDASGAYFDVQLSSASTFTSATITDCNLNGGDTLQWWNPAAGGGTGAWEPVAPAPTYTASSPPCVAFSLSSTSSPTISQLTGTAFAVGTQAVTRVFGQTADATAAAELTRAFPYASGSCPTSRAAVVATTTTYQDALSSQYLARSLTTGTLLTPTESLSPVTASALEHEGIETVYVVGGPLAVATTVVKAIEAMTAYGCGNTSPSGKITVTRIYGQSAYGTAEAVAAHVGSAPTKSFPGAYATTNAAGGTGKYNDTSGSGSSAPAGPVPTAILATGTAFQDAQAASVVSYHTKLPLLLTPATTLSQTAVSAIQKLGIKQVLLMGGPLAVTNTVEAALVSETGVSVVRVAGKDYTDTARELARFEVAGTTAGLGWTPGHRIMVARGTFFTDGMAGAVLDSPHNTATGASSARPLLLTESPTVVGSSLTTFLKLTGHTGIDGVTAKTITGLTVLGGKLAVSTATVKAMQTDLGQ
ncbi:MAG: cell wall-binding repeat-containing protein [Acidimicrobiales bacterium]